MSQVPPSNPVVWNWAAWRYAVGRWLTRLSWMCAGLVCLLDASAVASLVLSNQGALAPLGLGGLLSLLLGVSFLVGMCGSGVAIIALALLGRDPPGGLHTPEWQRQHLLALAVLAVLGLAVSVTLCLDIQLPCSSFGHCF